MPTVTHVALLRGINVGTAKRVAMADLRALFEELGYGDVRTLLNSGNVVFSAGKADVREAAARIEKGLRQKLGVSARVIALSASELDAVVRRNPLLKLADNPSRLLVGIAENAEDLSRLGPVVEKDWGKEKLAPGTAGAARAVYMWVPEGVIASKLSAAVNKALGEGATFRNWATMLKLNEMARPQDR